MEPKFVIMKDQYNSEIRRLKSQIENHEKAYSEKELYCMQLREKLLKVKHIFAVFKFNDEKEQEELLDRERHEFRMKLALEQEKLKMEYENEKCKLVSKMENQEQSYLNNEMEIQKKNENEIIEMRNKHKNEINNINMNFKNYDKIKIRNKTEMCKQGTE